MLTGEPKSNFDKVIPWEAKIYTATRKSIIFEPVTTISRKESTIAIDTQLEMGILTYVSKI